MTPKIKIQDNMVSEDLRSIWINTNDGFVVNIVISELTKSVTVWDVAENRNYKSEVTTLGNFEIKSLNK